MKPADFLDVNAAMSDPERERRQRVIDALIEIVALDDSGDFRKAARSRLIDLTDPEPQGDTDL